MGDRLPENSLGMSGDHVFSKSHDHNVNKGPWPWLQNGEFFDAQMVGL